MRRARFATIANRRLSARSRTAKRRKFFPQHPGSNACDRRVSMDGHPGLARSTECAAQWIHSGPEGDIELPPEPHLERWLERNTRHDTSIMKAARTANIIVDGPATLSVATWAYSHAAQLGVAAWVSGNIVEPLTGRWRSLLGAQAPQ
jgi:hypothetical protein